VPLYFTTETYPLAAFVVTVLVIPACATCDVESVPSAADVPLKATVKVGSIVAVTVT
jgi:hypothetical protein